MIPTDRSREATRTLATLNEQGACVSAQHPDWWYPERGRDDTAKAKTVCSGCPVKAMCASYALDHEDESGVWGGMSDEDRVQVRARLARVVPVRMSAPSRRRAVMPGSVMLPGLDEPWIGGESA